LIHDRHFTLAEANALLPRVDPMIRALRAARDQLTDTELHEVLAEAAPANGGGDPGRQVGEAFLAVRSLLAELQALGLVIRDLDRGLVDFPAIIDGREAYLCWEVGEDAIEFWHDLEAGYGGRRPLSDSGEGP
jgi:hypothetical protein